MTTQPHVMAEHTINPGRGVWVMLETLGVVIEGERVPTSYVVTTSSGYRATLPACDCERTPCLMAHDVHGHCHGNGYGRHLLHAQAFAEQVAKSYGSAKRKDAPRGLLAHPERVRNIPAARWRETDWAQTMEALAE